MPLIAAGLVLALLAGFATSVPARAAASLRTGLEAYAPPGPEGQLTMQRIRETGAAVVKIVVSWSEIAPTSRAAGFDPTNPFDPGYDWDELDRQVELATSEGLEPLVVLFGAPRWAEGGPGTAAGGISSPDPAQLALFARAAALRYDGANAGLPRVRYWGVWNEPNVSLFMTPQLQGGRPVSIARYRSMVNDVAGAVKGVRADNLVVAGELFPNEVNRPRVQAIGPLAFMRGLLCLSAGAHPHPICRTRVKADIISVHPYTSGGPSDRPANPDSVWIGNLSSLGSLVADAQRAGNLLARGQAGLWVTEFAWNTRPPRTKGVPVTLDARWIAEALYLMSRAGVGVATYFGLRDGPSGSIFQNGLYYSCPNGMQCDLPKPGLAAFRFPFVAYTTARAREVLVWGRTPAGVRASVQVQVRGTAPSASSWRGLAGLRSNGDGIFAARLRISGRESLSRLTLRAVLRSASFPGFPAASSQPGLASPGFSLTRPADLPVSPFG